MDRSMSAAEIRWRSLSMAPPVSHVRRVPRNAYTPSGVEEKLIPVILHAVGRRVVECLTVGTVGVQAPVWRKPLLHRPRRLGMAHRHLPFRGDVLLLQFFVF